MRSGFPKFMVVFALQLSVIFSFSAILQLSAQTRADQAELKIPEIIKIESGVEVVLPIEIIRQGSALDQTMLLVRGLPPSVTLTEGRVFPSGVWAINLSILSNVRVVTAPSTLEESQITVSIVTFEGDTVSEAPSRLVIGPSNILSRIRSSPQIEALATSAIETDQAEDRVAALDTNPSLEANIPSSQPGKSLLNEGNRPSRPSLNKGQEEKALMFMQQGDKNFSEGKINAARLFYQRAAEMGWPDGALAVGRTYDPNQLAKFQIVGGLKPDAALAKQWYQKARDLGSKFAFTQLKELEQRQ